MPAYPRDVGSAKAPGRPIGTRSAQAHVGRLGLLNEIVLWSLGAWWLGVTAAYVMTVGLPRRVVRAVEPEQWPGVSVVVPVKGIESEMDGNLEALCSQSYPDYELLFMVADPGDPAIAGIEAAILRHPAIQARIVVGDLKVSQNPKVNNLVKSEEASRHQLILMCDSNVAIQPDMLRSMVALLRPEIGLVSAIPVAVRPTNFIAEVECALTNGFGSRWLVAASWFGHPAAVGKLMLLRKADLARIGGIRAMATGICEDAALASAIGGLGLRVTATAEPVIYPVGRRGFREFWERQLRWHCCRRCHHRGAFFFQPFNGSMGAMLSGGIFWYCLVGTAALPGMVAFLAAWLGLEAVFLRRQGWPFSWRSPLAWLVRELLLPVLWVRAATTQTMMWRGSRMSIRSARHDPIVGPAEIEGVK